MMEQQPTEYTHDDSQIAAGVPFDIRNIPGGRFLNLVAQGGPLAFFALIVVMMALLCGFVIVAIVLSQLWIQFQISPAGQLVMALLTAGGIALALARWTGRQAQSASGVIGLMILGLMTGFLIWLIINSGFFSEARLDLMESRFRSDPARYVISIVILLTMAAGAILRFRYFIYRAYTSPFRFTMAVIRMTLLALFIVGVIYVVLFTDIVDTTSIREALLTPQPQTTPEGFR